MGVRFFVGLFLLPSLLVGDLARAAPPARETAWDSNWDRDDRRDGRRHDRRDDDGLSTGDILLGAAILAGIVAVVATAAKKIERDMGDTGDPDRRAAVDACTATAEREGRRFGADARVRAIEDVERDGERFRIKGEVEIDTRFGEPGDRERDWGGDRQRQRAAFTCTTEKGRVTAFRFAEDFEQAHRL